MAEERTSTGSTPIEKSRSPSSDEHDEKIEEKYAAANMSEAEKATTAPGIPRDDEKKLDSLDNSKLPLMDLDNDIVGWESQDDPAYARNFTQGRKRLILTFVSFMAFVGPLASSMFAPGVEFMDEDFGNTSELLGSLVVSIFVLGYVFGPLLLSPLSEIYGRQPVVFAGGFIFVVWQIGCALAPNLASLMVFRFLGGVGSGGCLTVGGGIISDLFAHHERGLAMASFSIGPLMGPVIGPIAGGFLSQQVGWRWVFWVLLIAAGVGFIGITLAYTETNAEIVIRHKTHKLRKSLGRPDLQSCYRDQTKTSAQILQRGIVVPVKLLFSSPISFILSLYMSIVYGLLFLILTSLTTVYETTYGWSAQLCGLAYLGIGVGFFFGIGIVAKTNDTTVARLTAANGGVYEPEMRLAACRIFAFFVPISFFWYGWAVQEKTHWVVPIIGMIPFGFGMIGVFIPIQTYMVDAFEKYAASAVACLVATRSIFGTFLPLAAPKMYEVLGYGWGNTLLGLIAILLVPAPFLIYKYGGGIRKKYPFAP